jgi:hypothetical protein
MVSPGESKDLWVFKTNLSGDIIWSNCFGGSKDDGSSWISENENGSFTILVVRNQLMVMFKEIRMNMKIMWFGC